MQELPALFQEKMDQLKSKGEPQDKAAVEEQILLANVSLDLHVSTNLIYDNNMLECSEHNKLTVLVLL